MIYKDRVGQLTATTGTGTYVLGSVISGYQGFSAIGTGNQAHYVCRLGGDWEVGLGTYTDAFADTLTRDVILDSSNGGAAVNWSAGDKSIFLTSPASQNTTISVKDFGAKGDGVTDDAAAVQAFFTSLAATGRKGYAPPGTYLLGSAVAVTSGTYGIHFSGAGMGKTIFKRGSFSGYTLRIHNLNHCDMSNFTVDGNRSNAGGTVGFDNANCSHSRFHRIATINCGTAGQWYISGADSITIENTHISECYSYNVGGSGIQLQGARFSGISNSFAKDSDIDGAGSGSGVYFKVPIEYCYHIGNSAENCRTAFTVGSSYSGSKGKFLTFANGRATNCDTAFRLGETEDSVFDGLTVLLNGETAAGLGDCVRYENGARRNTVTNLVADGVGASRAAGRFIGDAAGCSVHIKSFRNPATGAFIAAFEAGTSNNVVSVMPGHDATSGSAASMAGTANQFYVEGVPREQRATIASGAVTLEGPRVSLLIVDTEGSASTDDLTTINGGTNGQVIVVTTRADARDVVVKAGTTMRLAGAADFTLDRVRDSLVLMYSGLVSEWIELSRSDNLS